MQGHSLIPVVAIVLVLAFSFWRRRRPKDVASSNWTLNSFFAGKDRRRLSKSKARRLQIYLVTGAFVLVALVLHDVSDSVQVLLAAGKSPWPALLPPAAFIAALGVSFYFSQRQIARDEALVQRGTSAQARVEAIGLFTDRSGRGRIDLHLASANLRLKALVRDPHRFTKGDEVTVFYDAQEPKHALVFDEIESREWKSV